MTLKQSWVSKAVRALKISSAGIALLATPEHRREDCVEGTHLGRIGDEDRPRRPVEPPACQRADGRD